MKPQSTDIFDMVPFSPVTPLVPMLASNGCPPPPPTTLPPDISEYLRVYPRVADIFTFLSVNAERHMKNILIKLRSVKWQNIVRNIGHVMFIERGKKSLYGDTTSAHSPDHVMVVVGKDLFGAEPFDPFTCGAADFPPDIQSKLDEMQVSPRLSVCIEFLLSSVCLRTIARLLTLLWRGTAGRFPAVQFPSRLILIGL